MLAVVNRAVVVGVLVCVVACSRDRAKQRDQSEPTPSPIDKVRELEPTLRVEIVDEREVRVFTNDDDKESSISYLDNLARLCESDPPGCDEAVERFARTAVQMARAVEETTPVDPTRVRAVLKDDVYMTEVNKLRAEQASKSDAGAGGELAARRFAGDLWIVYVEDSPESMRMIRTDDFEELKLDADGVHALAMKNMRAALPDVPITKVDDIPNLWAVTAGDSYDAARMMLHDHWKPLLDIVDGHLVVAVPTRDLVAITGTGFPETVEVLRELAKQASEQDAYGLSAKLYKWTADGWEVY
jgi:uncharacterized protein YtpQ (UPF0354 family)